MENLNNQSTAVWYDGIAIARVIIGVLLMMDGWRFFESEDVPGLADLLFNMSIPFPEAMRYASATVGFVSGFFLILGLFTSLSTLLLFASSMLSVFLTGEGHLFDTGRGPFLLGMIALMFFFTGAGRISIDYILLINRKESSSDSSLPVSKRFGRYVSKG